MPSSYRFSPLFRGIGIVSVLAAMVLCGVFGILPATALTLRAFVTLALVAVGSGFLALWGLFIWLRHIGSLHLTEDALVLRRLGRERRLEYRAIEHIEMRGWPISAVVVKGAGQTLRFSRRVMHLPKFYALLQERCPAVKPVGRLPWRLQVRPLLFADRIGGILFILGFFAVIGWLFAPNNSDPAAVFAIIFLCGVLFASLILGGILMEFKNNPFAVTFMENEIYVRYLFGEDSRWSVKKIEAIEVITEERTIRSGKSMRSRYKVYPLSIRFEDGWGQRKFQLDEHWMRQGFGLTTRQAETLLRAAYGLNKTP